MRNLRGIMFRHGIMAKDKILYHKYLILDNLHTIRLQDIPDDINLESLRKDKVSECMNKFKAFIKSFI